MTVWKREAEKRSTLIIIATIYFIIQAIFVSLVLYWIITVDPEFRWAKSNLGLDGSGAMGYLFTESPSKIKYIITLVFILLFAIIYIYLGFNLRRKLWTVYSHSALDTLTLWSIFIFQLLLSFILLMKIIFWTYIPNRPEPEPIPEPEPTIVYVPKSDWRSTYKK
ncbi:hypothetical protein ACA758_00190 [Mycoplasmopsis agassizii]|uniref:hypothetical protein n=1 Tax=Mycoplasmopsis agassizii TaxID=33922 RepID=UPI00352853AB